jgi:uncharacterized protein (DUF2252 family)
MEQMVQGYCSAMIPQRIKKATKDPKNLRPVQTVLQQADDREWRHLAQERIEDVKPTIPLGERFWALSDEEKEEITKLFETEDARKLITSLKHRDNDAKVRVLDAAYWMKGCSSLGRLRYAVLLGVGPKKDKEYCLVDIKEAVRAAAPAAKNAAMPKDFAQRVVTGASNLSPYLGHRMLAAKFLGRPVVLRELMPQDLKLEIDRLTREEAVDAASYLACIVGKAHARQMDVATRKSWAAALTKNRSKTLNAPSWMWSSIVELIASHETAYLEHCRLYATA